ncbi:MAG TPA: hypothetical protein VFA20_06675 [Myxococcaceae bacterium]|nr:hypothetical protein [Myxococcaceae bacterium]
MSITNVSSQRPAVQPLQTQQTAFAPATQQAQRQDPLAALTKALEALEKAVQSLSSNKSFSNGQSVAQQAGGTNLGQSGASKTNPFDWSSLFGGGSTFEKNAAPTPPVQQKQDTTFLGGVGGGGGGAVQVNDKHDNGLHLGNEKSGGGGTGVRIGSDGANN